MKMFLLFATAIITSKVAFTQTHNEVWEKYNLYTKNPKVAASIDLNFRQQANYLKNNKNIFSLPLMLSSRFWLLYNLQNNYVLIGTFFVAKTYDIRKTDSILIHSTEIQFALGLSKKITLKK